MYLFLNFKYDTDCIFVLIYGIHTTKGTKSQHIQVHDVKISSIKWQSFLL